MSLPDSLYSVFYGKDVTLLNFFDVQDIDIFTLLSHVHRLLLTIKSERTIVITNFVDLAKELTLSLDQYLSDQVICLMVKDGRSTHIIRQLLGPVSARSVLLMPWNFYPLKTDMVEPLTHAMIATSAGAISGAGPNGNFLFVINREEFSTVFKGSSSEHIITTLMNLGLETISVEGMIHHGKCPSGSVGDCLGYLYPRTTSQHTECSSGFLKSNFLQENQVPEWTSTHGAGESGLSKTQLLSPTKKTPRHEWLCNCLRATMPCPACRQSYIKFREEIKPKGIPASTSYGGWESFATHAQLKKAVYDIHNKVNDKLDTQHFTQSLSDISLRYREMGDETLANSLEQMAPMLAKELSGRSLPFEKLVKRMKLSPGIDIRCVWQAVLIMTLNYFPQRQWQRVGFRALVPVLAKLLKMLSEQSCTKTATPTCLSRSYKWFSAMSVAPVGYLWALTSRENMFAWWCCGYAYAVACPNPKLMISNTRQKLELARAGVCLTYTCK